MSATGSAVVRMANQIALNFAVQGDEAAILATADHVETFWDPRMKAQAAALLAEPDSGLSRLARAALERVAQGRTTPSQTRATRFAGVDEGGHSDAG